MKQTGDLALMKKINKSIVMERIRHESPTSRARIAEKTGLTKATVSSLVAELISSDLVEEIGAGQSRGGRKPMLLLFNCSAGFAIGIDLGTDEITSILTDLNGRIVSESTVRSDNTNVDTAISALKACIGDLIKQAPISRYGVIGIGVGIPGFSDEQGNILFAPNLGWENIGLQAILEAEFAIPVVIENEANVGAVGEKRFGSSQAAASLVYVSIGAGIGTGIMLKEELYRGAFGYSGEMGHISIHHDGKPCRCGNLGCWELYASEHALIQEARAVYRDPTLDLDTLLKYAQAKETKALQLFTQHGRYLGIGIVNIINSLNPDRIIIGGRLALAEPWLVASMIEVVNKRSLPYPRAHLSIQFSTLGSKATVLGACSIAISRFFSSTKVWVE
ncbi:MAG: ROK family protein [Gorillibacterium sp.]|nr:ROK family protein [Gorillibacterium sp.]